MLEKAFGWLERLIYRACGVSPDAEKREMKWTTYAVAMLLFNVGGIVVVYAVQRLQTILPLNPDGMSAVTPDLSWNTAVSFVTNTNWQSYGGETTMSYFTQMVGPVRAELRLRRVGDRGSGGARARHLPQDDGHDRKFLGRSDALHALRARSFRVRHRARLRLSGRRADVLGGAARRAAAGDEGRIGQRRHRPGAGGRARRFARGHQAARHQRRRLLQRQRRPSFREPDAAEQLPVRSTRCCSSPRP